VFTGITLERGVAMCSGGGGGGGFAEAMKKA